MAIIKKFGEMFETVTQGSSKNDNEIKVQNDNANTTKALPQKKSEVPAKVQKPAQTEPTKTPTQSTAQTKPQATQEPKKEESKKPAGLDLKERLKDGNSVFLKFGEDSLIKLTKAGDKFKITSLDGEFGLEEGDILTVVPNIIKTGIKCVFTDIKRGDKKLVVKGAPVQFVIDSLTKVSLPKAKSAQGTQQKSIQKVQPAKEVVAQNTSFKYDAYGKIKING